MDSELSEVKVSIKRIPGVQRPIPCTRPACDEEASCVIEYYQERVVGDYREHIPKESFNLCRLHTHKLFGRVLPKFDVYERALRRHRRGL